MIKQDNKTTKNKLTKLALEKLDLLNGCEIHTLQYEGCVCVKGNKLHIPHYDKTITITTEEQVNDLWDEYVQNEGLY